MALQGNAMLREQTVTASHGRELLAASFRRGARSRGDAKDPPPAKRDMLVIAAAYARLHSNFHPPANDHLLTRDHSRYFAFLADNNFYSHYVTLNFTIDLKDA